MKKSILLLFILLSLGGSLFAQRRTLPVGSQIIVKEITSWDPQFSNQDKIVGKTAVVSKRPLLFSGEDHYSGYISVDGIEYRILDMRIKIITGEKPEKKIEPKNVLKFKDQLIELARMSSEDFSSIKTTFPKASAGFYGSSFLANYSLNGSIDSSTLIYFDDYVNHWNLQTQINTDQYSAEGLDYIFRTLNFPFGKLEPLPGQDKIIDSGFYAKYYVPVDRMKLNNNYRYFTVLLNVGTFKHKNYFLSINLLNRSFDPKLFSEQIEVSEPVVKNNTKKLANDILYLLKLYKDDFKEIKTTKLITERYWKETYETNYNMEGSEPGGASVYFDTLAKKWSFTTFIDTKLYSEHAFDSILLSIDYPFGKLERIESDANPDLIIYTPKSEEQVPAAYKGIRLSVHKYYLNNKLYSQLFSIIKYKN